MNNENTKTGKPVELPKVFADFDAALEKATNNIAKQAGLNPAVIQNSPELSKFFRGFAIATCLGEVRTIPNNMVAFGTGNASRATHLKPVVLPLLSDVLPTYPNISPDSLVQSLRSFVDSQGSDRAKLFESYTAVAGELARPSTATREYMQQNNISLRATYGPLIANKNWLPTNGKGR